MYITIKLRIRDSLMKTFRRVVSTILILMIGICGLLFVGYKLVLDKPGFFRQFDNAAEARAFLVDNLALNEVSREYAIDYINQRLSDGESCTPLRDISIDRGHCPISGCPAVTDQTINTAIHCFVHTYDIFLEYEISLFFEYNILTNIDVIPLSGLP